MIPTEADLRLAHAQALANTRIEGHEPTPEFLADCEAVNRGQMTLTEARARSLARAQTLCANRDETPSPAPSTV
jgi:hypothetical protein